MRNRDELLWHLNRIRRSSFRNALCERTLPNAVKSITREVSLKKTFFVSRGRVFLSLFY